MYVNLHSFHSQDQWTAEASRVSFRRDRDSASFRHMRAMNDFGGCEPISKARFNRRSPRAARNTLKR